MEFVTYEVKDRVGIITISREKALNALNSQVLDELGEAFDAVDLNEIRCIVLTGAAALQKPKEKHSARRVMTFSERSKHSLFR